MKQEHLHLHLHLDRIAGRVETGMLALASCDIMLRPQPYTAASLISWVIITFPVSPGYPVL